MRGANKEQLLSHFVRHKNCNKPHTVILNIGHIRHPVFSIREIFKWKGMTVLSFDFVTPDSNVMMYTIFISDKAKEGLSLFTRLLQVLEYHMSRQYVLIYARKLTL